MTGKATGSGGEGSRSSIRGRPKLNGIALPKSSCSSSSSPSSPKFKAGRTGGGEVRLTGDEIWICFLSSLGSRSSCGGVKVIRMPPISPNISSSSTSVSLSVSSSSSSQVTNDGFSSLAGTPTPSGRKNEALSSEGANLKPLENRPLLFS